MRALVLMSLCACAIPARAGGPNAYARLILAGSEGQSVMVRGVSDDGGRAIIERTERAGAPYRASIQALTRQPDGWRIADLVGPGLHFGGYGGIDASAVGLTRDGRWLIYRFSLVGEQGAPKLRALEIDSGREEELEASDPSASRWYRANYGQAPRERVFADARDCSGMPAAIENEAQGHVLSVAGEAFPLDRLAGTYPEGRERLGGWGHVSGAWSGSWRASCAGSGRNGLGVAVRLKERFGYTGGVAANALGGYAQDYLFEFGLAP